MRCPSGGSDSALEMSFRFRIAVGSESGFRRSRKCYKCQQWQVGRASESPRRNC